MRNLEARPKKASPERAEGGKPEVSVHPGFALLESFRNSGLREEEISGNAREVLRKAKIELYGTDQALDGAEADLTRASITLHTDIIRALGSVARTRDPLQADELTSKGLGLLQLKGRFADKA